MKISYEQCCVKGCGHSPFPMATKFRERCIKTHEYFYCPGGHGQHFTGESEETKLRRKVKNLECKLSDAEWRVRGLRKQANRCPWVGCKFVARPMNDFDMRAMWSHLRSAHGMPTKGQVLAELHESDNLTTDEK